MQLAARRGLWAALQQPLKDTKNWALGSAAHPLEPTGLQLPEDLKY